MELALIAAVARNGVIGRDGALPWHLPDDLARFKALTTGHTIVMGRRTWESIGRPLPRRTSIVVTRQAALPVPDEVVLLDSLDSALEWADKLCTATDAERAFVIGGAALYTAALPHAGRLFLTRVHADVPGDVRVPEFAAAALEREWILVDDEPHPADERHEHAFSFEEWERRAR